ncbi:DUF4097 family beta strand repeat-containing protein [Pedobacter sp. BMA]|uniref:DUF4097 family beta strand repeat-containing protein n=1 Tax=Pedobacter sp. BMA TaxID=1663685 RepID=UPI00064AB68A|nr:DUF4097 family beta strand repeat-containing protein [Pedobacter sp. BMA]KLT64784.1 hypothetical protein AB669_13680 [Pedobacter sp. BMA]
MKKQLQLVVALTLLSLSVSAQKEYKLAKSSGKLNLNLSGATVEGYNGAEIIFSSPASEKEQVDERAKGLKAVNSSGFKDNTGLGLDVTVKGEDINVNPVSLTDDRRFKIRVPQNIKVVFTNNSSMYQDSVTLKNLKSEIEVSVNFNEVKLENNTGPVNVKTLNGSVDAVFAGEIKGPISIVSVHGHVDVALPKTAKVSLEAGTNYGKIYAAEGLNIAIEKEAVEKTDKPATGVAYTTNGSVLFSGLVSGSGAKASTNTLTTQGGNRVLSAINISMRKESENIKGKINGGGTVLILKSNHDSIYIREK